MEGFLPPMWCLIWYIVMIPIVGYGLYQIRKMVDENPDITALLAVSGAFMFVLSSLKLPSVTGSCSHPCGNGYSVQLLPVYSQLSYFFSKHYCLHTEELPL